MRIKLVVVQSMVVFTGCLNESISSSFRANKLILRKAGCFGSSADVVCGVCSIRH